MSLALLGKGQGYDSGRLSTSVPFLSCIGPGRMDSEPQDSVRSSLFLLRLCDARFSTFSWLRGLSF